MWQHQIFEDVKKLNSYSSEYESLILPYIRAVSDFPCFFIGDCDSILNISTFAKVKNTNSTFVLTPDFPFSNFFLEYVYPCSSLPNTEKQSSQYKQWQSSKRVLFVSQVPESYINHPLFRNADFFISGFYYFDELKRWDPVPVTVLGKWYSSQIYFRDPLFICPNIYKQIIKDNPLITPIVGNELVTEICVLKAFLEFINCKNVYTETVVPKEKINKKRIKENKEPFYEYKILKITKGAVKEKHSSITHPWNKLPSDIITAKHICRGHYKEYTEEGKLFGRYTGRFWWNAQVRGSEKNGIITKDYTLV